MVGEIIIGTKLDTKQLEQQLKDQRKRFEDYNKEAEKLAETKLKTEAEVEEMEMALKYIQQMKEEELELAQTEEERAQIQEDWAFTEKVAKAGVEATKEELEGVNKQIAANLRNQELVKQEIIETNNQLRAAKDIKNIRGFVDDIGKSLKKTIRNVARWGLALFGIRGAFNAIRSAMNIISQGDKQLKADIDYIKNVLAYTLEPIIRAIVNFLKQMMIYIAYIIRQWTGKDIFGDASKKLNEANKSAKELHKTLAGFDEMNVVGSQNNAGAGAPSFSLENIGEGDVPGWVDWIAKNGKLIATIIGGIAAAIAGFKFGELVSHLVQIGGALAPIGTFIATNLPLIAGILMVVSGLIIFIKGIIDYLNDPTWGNFGKILVGIGIIAAGVLLIFGGVPALITLIIGLIAAIGVAVYKNWDKIKATFEKVKTWIVDKFIGGIKSKFNALPGWAKTLIKGIVNTAITMINGLISRINLILAPLRVVIAGIGLVMGKGWNFETISIPKIPYLAKGGIVNLPSRGVPIGGALAGERGQEGVIPLTDSQQMALLGEAIGKYITINATVVNSMNGRILSREMHKIQNQNDFAMNR